ncbi:MAG: UvrD-helicase domain-containing protein [Candidatus Gottesmanbacteria bacterium]
MLNTEQKKAVTFGKGPLLIIAGAGTGKTTVISERIHYLISSKKARPEEILALTFTEKASREMEERVDLTMPYGTTQMWISTFHAFCDRVLKNESLSIGLNPNFKLMGEAESIQFFTKHLFEFTLEYFRPLGNPTKFISGILQHFSRLKDEDITPGQYMVWVTKFGKKATSPEKREEYRKYEELANAYRKYEELKTKESLADYGDLIANTLTVFRTRKKILAQYQKQFKYILIDEFQDTNFAQNEIAMLLAGTKQNITVVGDDDQAIYRWRGAAISNIIQFRKHFKKAKIVVLTKNYRSTQEILNRSYDLIQHNNPDRLEVVEKINKRLECTRRVNGERVVVLNAERVEDEAELVAKEITKLCGDKISWKDVAILVRANAHAEAFVRALSRAGIPFQFLGPGQLFRQPEVKDIIAYLKLLSNIHDSVSMYRVLTMDVFDVSPRDVAEIVSYAKQHTISIFSAIEELQKNIVAVKSIVAMILKHLALIKKETAGQIAYYFLQDSGLLQSLTVVTNTKEQHRAENIAKFFDKVKTYEADHEDASIFAVVDWLDLAIDLGESPLASNSDWGEINAVNILTVHSAKGLEFKAVFLVNLVSARFPTNERHEQIPIPDALVKEILPVGDYHMEEERRLFYVGITRAKDRLYLTGAKYYGDGKREKKLSPFIQECLGNQEISSVTRPPEKNDKQLFLIDWSANEATLSKAQKLEPKKPITSIWYTHIESFKRCPLQYKYRYVIKIPVPTSAALGFGDIVHKTMQEFYKRVIAGEEVTKEMLLALYREQWKSKGFISKAYEAEMKKHGEELLSEYFEKGYDKKTKTIAVEQAFKIKISKNITLGGKIDRIDRTPKGTLEIIDYKTGAAPKKRDPQEDFQLSLYALAAADPGVYGEKPESIVVSFYFFEGQERISGTRTKEKLQEMKKEIINVVEEMNKSDFHAAPGMHCAFCEYRLLCEAWK